MSDKSVNFTYRPRLWRFLPAEQAALGNKLTFLCMASDLNTIIVVRYCDVSSPLKKDNRYEESNHDFFSADDDMDDMDELDTTKEAEMASIVSSVVAELKEAEHFESFHKFFQLASVGSFPMHNISLLFFLDVIEFFQQTVQ